MADLETIEAVKEIDVDKYKYGFETIIESDMAPKGLSEEVIRFISAKKEEPEWMLEQRLEAYHRWLKMDEPSWAKVSYPKIDFNDIYYYSAPKGQTGPKSLDEVDPELLATYAKLGIPLKEQEILAGVRKQGEPSQLDEEGGPSYGSGNVAVDAVFDSVSVVTTFKKELAKAGVIFCSISEAIREHPELVKKYLGSVVPVPTTYYAALNSAVFLRRLVRLHPRRRALPDGAVDLFPHQRREHRPVRAHADHRRQGLLCLLPGRLHRADARREPASRRRG
jgi:Fe-S cluster assembly protein SufB